MSDMTITINGKQIDGCISANVARSVTRAVSVASLELPLRVGVSPGVSASIRIGDARVYGWVTAVVDDLASGRRTVTVESRTCRLLYRSYGVAGRWRGAPAADIVKNVCASAKVEVEIRCDLPASVNLDADPANTCWQVVSDALRGSGAYATDDNDGRLIVDRPAPGDALTARVADCISVVVTRDIRNRRSAYTMGRVSWGDGPVSASASDKWMLDLSWDMWIRAPARATVSQMRDMLCVEALRRAGQSITVSVVLPGVFAGPGRWVALGEEDFWVLDWAAEVSQSGTRTTMSLGYPEAIGSISRMKSKPSQTRRMLDVGLQ